MAPIPPPNALEPFIGEMPARKRAKRLSLHPSKQFVTVRVDELERAIKDAEARAYLAGWRSARIAVISAIEGTAQRLADE